MSKKIINCVCLSIIGICIGILTGLSVSPVIQTVLSSILSVVITAVSIWVGLSDKGEDGKLKHLSKFNLNIIPLTLLVVGITFGAMLGVYIRTHHVLGDVGIYNKKEHPDKQKPKEVDANKTKNDHADNSSDKQDTAGLFVHPQSTRDILESFSGKQLIYMLGTLGDKKINKIIDSCHSDPELVKQKVSEICKKQ